jgi:hypothetical protein
MIDAPDWVTPRKREESHDDSRRVRKDDPKPTPNAPRKPRQVKPKGPPSAPKPPKPPKPPPKPKTWKDAQAARERKETRKDGPRPLGMDCSSLGNVTVVAHNDKAIMVVGGDTAGETWIPRSQILDGPLDRRAKKGDVGEIWLPQWLADKVPW